MDALSLARLEFGGTAVLHFMFVALTLGLVPLVAIMETRFALTGNALHARMTRYWGRIYVVNYAVGIVTGLVMEFQIGMNWSGLTDFTGNVFGAPLAIETMVAFFAESTFLGLWVFGWGHLPRGVHCVLIWLVVLTAYLSAFWVLVANAFLNHPVGYRLAGGVAYLTDPWALVDNPNFQVALGHVIGASWLGGGAVVAGLSARHLLRRTAERDLFLRSLRLGVLAGAIGAPLAVVYGFRQADVIGAEQPITLAAAGVSESGRLAALLADMVARHGPGDYLPPVAIIKPAAIAMFASGELLVLGGLLTAVLLIGNLIARIRPYLWLMVLFIPVPFLIMICGWLVREVGRQPWVVYGLLPTAKAISPMSPAAAAWSSALFLGVTAVLALVDWGLIAHVARGGPEAATAGPDTAPEPVWNALEPEATL